MLVKGAQGLVEWNILVQRSSLLFAQITDNSSHWPQGNVEVILNVEAYFPNELIFWALHLELVFSECLWIPLSTLFQVMAWCHQATSIYSISQEICTRFLLCCGYTLTDFPISIRLTSLALWQSNDCLGASKATLMNMDKYFMWIHYERLHNHNKAKHNKTVCIFLGIYCTLAWSLTRSMSATMS